MRRSTLLAIGILVVVLVVAGLWMYHSHGLYEKSYRSEYYYHVTLRTDSILYNVTLYVPVPLIEDESRIGDAIVTGKASIPAEWDCSIVETEHGTMLKISVEKIVPEFRSLPVPLEPGEEPKAVPEENVSDAFSEDTPVLIPNEIIVQLPVDHEISTKNPLGNEPLLSPMYNVTRVTCDFPDGQDTRVNCSSYESRIYADYAAASPHAEVSIYIDLNGRNSWWVYGWSSNGYRDRIITTFTGEQHGWHVASGELLAGEGRYGWL
ncbi:MAG: hypothetical protein IBX41_03150 [Methanophagales archaeon]|nr:hypothetical protein [Methanophagales archaeon]